MDPKPLRLIVSLLGMVTVAAGLFELAAAWLATHLTEPTIARRLAGSRAWAGLANATSVSLLTALVIEFALTGRFEALLVWGIVAASYLICWLFDRARGRS
jgi:hypothetical protein